MALCYPLHDLTDREHFEENIQYLLTTKTTLKDNV